MITYPYNVSTGENNANANPEMYSCSFPAMISDWREKWYLASNQQTAGQFPFGFVQVIHNYNYEHLGRDKIIVKIMVIIDPTTKVH